MSLVRTAPASPAGAVCPEIDPRDLHPSRAIAASSARRTWTVATWARYSRSAWMSEATVTPSVACAAAASIDAPAADGLLDGRRPVRVLPDPGDPDRAEAPALAVVRSDDGRDTRDRVAARGLLDRPIGRSDVLTATRQPELRDQLVGLEHALERALEERRGRDDPLALGGARHDLGVEGQQDRRHVRGGVGVGDRAADRAPVADLDVADVRERVGEEPVVAEDGVAQHLVIGRQGPDRDPAVRQPSDALQLGQPSDVDEGLRPGQPELHERQQALARRRSPWPTPCPRQGA